MTTAVRHPAGPFVVSTGVGDDLPERLRCSSLPAELRGLRTLVLSFLANSQANEEQVYWREGGSIWHVNLIREPVAEDAIPVATVELSSPSQRPHGLTLREIEVLTLVAGGLTNPEISALLYLARKTVSALLERILDKLDVPNRTGAATVAVSEGLLLLPVAQNLSGGPPLALPSWLQTGKVATDRARTTRPVTRSPLKIGALYPTRGLGFDDGLDMSRGAQLAVDEVNRRGGVAGRSVIHVARQVDISSAASIRAGIAALAAEDVAAMTLGYCFARADYSRIFAEIADVGVPTLHSETSLAVDELVKDSPLRYQNVFQVCAPEAHYGMGFVRAISSLRDSGQWRPKSRRIVILDTDDPFMKTFDARAAAAAESGGWTNIAYHPISATRPDWDGVLRILRDTEPAAVMVACFVADELVDFLRRLRLESQAPPLLYAIYAPSDPTFLEKAGDAADHLLWATLTGLYQDRLGVRYSDSFTARYGSAPGSSSSSIHYDMVKILCSAWAHPGSPFDWGRVSAEIRHGVYRGINGSYWFDNHTQRAMSFPDDTLDASLAQAHLVYQVQNQRHRIVLPEPFATASPTFPGGLIA